MYLNARALLLLALLLLCQCASYSSRPRTVNMNPDTSRWTARDGREFPYTRWPGPHGAPRAVLICVHGLSGAASDFWPVGESLPAGGFAVYGLQLRGQGNDPDHSRRGDINSRQQWIQDLMDFTAAVRSRHPGVPLYYMGESLGALISLHTAASCPQACRPDGLILTSPVVAFRPGLQLPFFKNLAVRTIMRVLPGRRISLEALGNSEVQVTSGTTHREQMQHTAHYVKDFTLRLFGQVEQMVLTSRTAAARLEMPVLVFYTPHDALTPQEGVESFFDSIAATNKQKVLFKNSYHLILHDGEREAALAQLRTWLDARTPHRRHAD